MVNNIKKIREEKGYSQQELAILLGISSDYLGKIERGKREPSLKLVVRIAKIFDCTLNDLFFY